MKLDFKNIRTSSLVTGNRGLVTKYKPFLGPMVAILISIAVLFFVFRPKLNDILDLREEVRQDKVRLEAIKSKAAELAGLDEQDLEEDLKLVNRALPFEKDAPSAIIGLERLAADSGLIIETLAISPGEVSTDSAKADPSNEVEIKLSIRGPFSSIKNYTKKVRESLRVFGIKDVVIVAPAEDPSNLGFSTSVIVFFSPLPENRGNIETPLPKISEDDKELMNKIANYQFVSNVPLATGSSREDPFSRF